MARLTILLVALIAAMATAFAPWWKLHHDYFVLVERGRGAGGGGCLVCAHVSAMAVHVWMPR
eukprot:scaffold6360_cov219-Skeletonema_menzelii.AAC.5